MKLVRKDEIIAREGDQDNDIYILIKGTIGVYKGEVEISRFTDKGTIIPMINIVRVPYNSNVNPAKGAPIAIPATTNA